MAKNDRDCSDLLKSRPCARTPHRAAEMSGFVPFGKGVSIRRPPPDRRTPLRREVNRYHFPDMPKRIDLHKVLLIGSGPIVIGQACEFDYSGTQACKALREEGYEVVLVNSNPATIMTDPDTADRTYIEPITWEVVAQIIEREKPDAVLPTLGGQTGLNTAMALHKHGVLAKFGVELIGARADVIDRAEDREK